MDDRDLKAVVAELRELEAKAFRAPWRAHTFEITCPGDSCDAAVNAAEDECGYDHEIAEVDAPEEYPASPTEPADVGHGQCVAQIDTPGLATFARRNAEFIAATRNALPRLLARLDALERVAEAARVALVRMRPCIVCEAAYATHGKIGPARIVGETKLCAACALKETEAEWVVPFAVHDIEARELLAALDAKEPGDG